MINCNRTVKSKITGDIYYLVIDKATNVSDNINVVVYYKDGQFYVQDETKFYENYESNN